MLRTSSSPRDARRAQRPDGATTSVADRLAAAVARSARRSIARAHAPRARRASPVRVGFRPTPVKRSSRARHEQRGDDKKRRRGEVARHVERRCRAALAARERRPSARRRVERDAEVRAACARCDRAIAPAPRPAWRRRPAARRAGSPTSPARSRPQHVLRRRAARGPRRGAARGRRPARSRSTRPCGASGSTTRRIGRRQQRGVADRAGSRTAGPRARRSASRMVVPGVAAVDRARPARAGPRSRVPSTRAISPSLARSSTPSAAARRRGGAIVAAALEARGSIGRAVGDARRRAARGGRSTCRPARAACRAGRGRPARRCVLMRVTPRPGGARGRRVGRARVAVARDVEAPARRAPRAVSSSQRVPSPPRCAAGVARRAEALERRQHRGALASRMSRHMHGRARGDARGVAEAAAGVGQRASPPARRRATALTSAYASVCGSG